MKVVTTNFGKGIFLSDTELLTLGFIAVNLLGETGSSYYDNYVKKLVSSVLSNAQLSVLEELLKAIRKEANYVR